MSDNQNPAPPANAPEDDELSVDELDDVSGGGGLYSDTDETGTTINSSNCNCTNNC